MEKIFITATSGADSGNDAEEEDGGLGVGLEAPAGFTVGYSCLLQDTALKTQSFFIFSVLFFICANMVTLTPGAVNNPCPVDL